MTVEAASSALAAGKAPRLSTCPSRLPTTIADRSLQCWTELGIGEFQVQFELAFDGPLDTERLARAVHLAMDAEPVLGCRFVLDHESAWWERLPERARGALVTVADEAAFERFRASRVEATVGPQLKACLWRASDGDRLLLKITHQAADGGGCLDLGAILADLYTRLKREPGHVPAPNLGSRSLDQVAARVPLRAYPALLRNLLRRLGAGLSPKTTHMLELAGGARHPWGYVVRQLEVARVQRLSAYASARGATLNDLLLAAFYRGLAQHTPWDGRSAHRVDMLVDYRRWYLPTRRAAAVCNLSGFEHPYLGRELGRDLDATLAKLSAITQRRKQSWLGLSELWLVQTFERLSYPRLRSIYQQIMKSQMAAQNLPHTFSNGGMIEPERLEFDGVAPRTAWLLSPVGYPPLFGAAVTSYKGALTLSAGVPDSARATIERFMDGFVAELPA